MGVAASGQDLVNFEEGGWLSVWGACECQQDGALNIYSSLFNV